MNIQHTEHTTEKKHEGTEWNIHEFMFSVVHREICRKWVTQTNTCIDQVKTMFQQMLENRPRNASSTLHRNMGIYVPAWIGTGANKANLFGRFVAAIYSYRLWANKRRKIVFFLLRFRCRKSCVSNRQFIYWKFLLLAVVIRIAETLHLITYCVRVVNFPKIYRVFNTLRIGIIQIDRRVLQCRLMVETETDRKTPKKRSTVKINKLDEMIKGRVSMIIVVLNAYWTGFSEAVSFNVVWFFRSSHFDGVETPLNIATLKQNFSLNMPGICFEVRMRWKRVFSNKPQHTRSHAFVFMWFNCEQHILLILNLYGFFMKSNLVSYCFVRTRIISQVALAKSQEHEHKKNLLFTFSSRSDRNAINNEYHEQLPLKNEIIPSVPVISIAIIMLLCHLWRIYRFSEWEFSSLNFQNISDWFILSWFTETRIYLT